MECPWDVISEGPSCQHARRVPSHALRGREGDAGKAVQAIRAHAVVQDERFAGLLASLGGMAAAGVPPEAPAKRAARA